MYNKISSSATTAYLIPVLPANVPDIIELACNESVRRLSTLFSPLLNLTEADNELLANRLHSNNDMCTLFKAVFEQDEKPGLFIGLYDVDRIQGRGYIAYLCSDTDLRKKKLYEPVKLLCARAFGEWRMDRLYIILESNDNASITMFKGFGFIQTAAIEGYSRWKDEPVDVLIFSCIKKNFRSFNAAL